MPAACLRRLRFSVVLLSRVSARVAPRTARSFYAGSGILPCVPGSRAAIAGLMFLATGPCERLGRWRCADPYRSHPLLPQGKRGTALVAESRELRHARMNPMVTCGTTRRDMTTLDAVESAHLRSDIPSFQPGDTLRVHVKVVEGNRTRVQVFQGVCLRRSGSGIRETFTVRKVSFGVGVERTFPVHSPIIEKIEVASRGDVRRAKLYYLRGLHGKAAKIKERREPTPGQ